jgi:hypothetical protein
LGFFTLDESEDARSSFFGPERRAVYLAKMAK